MPPSDKPLIVLVESEDRLRSDWTRLIPAGSYGIKTFDGTEASVFDVPEPAVFIIGYPGRFDALRLCRELRARFHSSIVFVAKQSSEQIAIDALRSGVNEYLRLPLDRAELEDVLLQCLPIPPVTVHVETDSNARLVGASQAMDEVRASLRRLAVTDATVLITGETGTGKDLASEWIHNLSARRSAPFVSINCAALPDTLFESELFGFERGAFTGATGAYEGKISMAERGTVFLDEIGDLSPIAQAKILRVIEGKPFHRLGGRTPITPNVRFIAATNHDLETLAKDGRFRSDLLFRLSVARIHIPPLRERKEDISLLLTHHLERMNQRYGRNINAFEPDAFNALINYDWPGNVREFGNLVESAVINSTGTRIGFMELPSLFRAKLVPDVRPVVMSPDRDRLLSVLHQTEWNVSRAAKKMQWSRMTMYRKIAEYQIPWPTERARRKAVNVKS
jgi:DNA-binding NtrC family response regulator